MQNNCFIFVRHGQSKANAERIIADAHSPLTESGIEQARRTGNEVKEFNISNIVCSPYLRAQQTAETLAGEIGIELSHIKVIDDLQERGLGILEDKPREHEGIWYFMIDGVEGIEPTKDLYERMSRCFAYLCELAKEQNLLVVGHAISGFYLTQISQGKKSVEEFDSPSQMSNADFIKINI